MKLSSRVWWPWWLHNQNKVPTFHILKTNFQQATCPGNKKQQYCHRVNCTPLPHLRGGQQWNQMRPLTPGWNQGTSEQKWWMNAEDHHVNKTRLAWLLGDYITLSSSISRLWCSVILASGADANNPVVPLFIWGCVIVGQIRGMCYLCITATRTEKK